MLAANIVFSPDDDGWYAEIWRSSDGHQINVIPPDHRVLDSRAELIRAIGKEYGSIHLFEDSTD